MDKIEKIRAEIAEIERRMKEGYSSGDKDVDSVARGVCAGILSFLDTLSEEPAPKGYDEAYLNEKIAKASKTWEGVDVDKYMDEVRGREPDKSLEEAAEEWCKGNHKGIALTADGSHYLAEGLDAFIAGAKWQKSQMLKDAVEADVYAYKAPRFNCGFAEFVVAIPSAETDKLGDKVKLIIVKED